MNPRNGNEVRRLDARRTFALLARCAWLSGEPGVLFLDRINADNPTPELGRLESTNPCGELPLLPYESCNLGSVNLGCFVADGSIDWSSLGAAVHWGVRLLDNVIETTAFPLPEVAEATHKSRKIGLGVMGFADLLIELGVGYGTPRALELAGEVMSFVHGESRKASQELAVSRGPLPRRRHRGASPTERYRDHHRPYGDPLHSGGLQRGQRAPLCPRLSPALSGRRGGR